MDVIGNKNSSKFEDIRKKTELHCTAWLRFERKMLLEFPSDIAIWFIKLWRWDTPLVHDDAETINILVR